jgi:hypothetical protein
MSNLVSKIMDQVWLVLPLVGGLDLANMTDGCYEFLSSMRFAGYMAIVKNLVPTEYNPLELSEAGKEILLLTQPRNNLEAATILESFLPKIISLQTLDENALVMLLDLIDKSESGESVLKLLPQVIEVDSLSNSARFFIFRLLQLLKEKGSTGELKLVFPQEISLENLTIETADYYRQFIESGYKTDFATRLIFPLNFVNCSLQTINFLIAVINFELIDRTGEIISFR